MVETKETAAASAERRDDIAAGLRRLPDLPARAAPDDGRARRRLRGPDARAARTSTPRPTSSTTFLENLEPLSESTQANLRSLAEASRKGRPAVKAAQPVVAELNAATEKAPELANNAAIVFEHLNDRKHAVEKDPRSPGGQGYTGFEAVLQWVFDQSQAINIYDKNGYILKVNLFHSKCSDYQNPQSLKEEMEEDPSFYKDCAAILGPNQPSITTPDPTATGNQFASERADAAKKPSEEEAGGQGAKPKPEEPVKDKLREQRQGPGRGGQEEARQGRAAQARHRAAAQTRSRRATRTSRSCASASRTASASSCRSSTTSRRRREQPAGAGPARSRPRRSRRPASPAPGARASRTCPTPA